MSLILEANPRVETRTRTVHFGKIYLNSLWQSIDKAADPQDLETRAKKAVVSLMQMLLGTSFDRSINPSSLEAASNAQLRRVTAPPYEKVENQKEQASLLLGAFMLEKGSELGKKLRSPNYFKNTFLPLIFNFKIEFPTKDSSPQIPLLRRAPETIHAAEPTEVPKLATLLKDFDELRNSDVSGTIAEIREALIKDLSKFYDLEIRHTPKPSSIINRKNIVEQLASKTLEGDELKTIIAGKRNGEGAIKFLYNILSAVVDEPKDSELGKLLRDEKLGAVFSRNLFALTKKLSKFVT